MLSLPKPINEIMSDCVGAVSQRILPDLQRANSNIEALSFMFGHPLELKNRLKEMSESATERYLKFPVVMLFSDVQTSPASVKGSYQDVTLNMAIAMSTQPEYTASKRDLENFAPILRPIYAELIQAIFKCGYFWVQTPRELLGRSIERFFWGKEGIQGNTANQFNDYIDAIEIKGLKLNQSKKGNTVTANTYTQFMEFFLSQTRATITVGTVTDNKITNNFFLTAISSIEAELQVYFVTRDFTQNTTTGEITGINVQFYTGQIIMAYR